MSLDTTYRMEPVDGDVLAVPSRTGPEHGPVLAHRAGLSVAEGTERLQRLAEEGVVERVTAEPLYRLTDRGRRLTGEASEAGRSTVTGD